MPFPQDRASYEQLVKLADSISTAIESLDVQVDWSGVRVVGVDDPEDFDPLFLALGGDPEAALASFTREIFCYGNVTLAYANGQARAWPPWWASEQIYLDALPHVELLEAKNPPLAGSFGTPVLEPALDHFKAYWSLFTASIAALESHANNPATPPPRAGAQLTTARNKVLASMGFTPQPNDVAHYQHAAKLRRDMHALFESSILLPFANVEGITGTPRLAF